MVGSFRLVLLLLCTLSFETVAQPLISRGQLDGRAWDFNQSGPLKLDGQWNFYWQKLLLPGQAIEPSGDYFQFPGVWNGKSSLMHQLDGHGFATYSARILTNPAYDMLSLELPDVYSNYYLWANGQLVASNGEVGTSRAESVPQWLPKTVVIRSSDTLDLVLQVSNFYHRRGGSNDHIYIGTPEQLYEKRESAVITNIILFSGLGLIGCFFVILFLFFRKDKAALYFAAICLTWAVRAVFTNLYLFINWFPSLDWELAVKIEYLTLYLTMMWSLMFVGELFQQDTNPITKYGLLIVNFIFILFTVASPAVTYTSMLSFYMIVAWVILGYVAFVVIKAIVYERAGAWFSAGSIILGVVMFSYDMLTFQGIWDFSPLLFNIGYLAIFFLNATAFAHQLSRTIKPKPAMEFGLTLK
jgi:hypothetical protein